MPTYNPQCLFCVDKRQHDQKQHAQAIADDWRKRYAELLRKKGKLVE